MVAGVEDYGRELDYEEGYRVEDYDILGVIRDIVNLGRQFNDTPRCESDYDGYGSFGEEGFSYRVGCVKVVGKEETEG